MCLGESKETAKTVWICIISPWFYCGSIERLTKTVPCKTLFMNVVEDMPKEPDKIEVGPRGKVLQYWQFPLLNNTASNFCV